MPARVIHQVHRVASLALLAGTLIFAACLNGPEASGPNTPPTAVIALPGTGATFQGGDSIAFRGSATDPEDGSVPAARLTWWVELHHDTHTHPFMPRTTATSGAVYVPPIGETSDNIFLRFYLEAIDGSGAADTVTRDVQPEKVQFVLATEPAGLTVTLDGQPVTTPDTIIGVVGMERELGVTTPTSSGSTAYTFVSWSDGGAATHRIVTPDQPVTFLARFQAATTGPLPNQPPVVAISAPANGSAVVVNSAITITATASDPDGTVQRVRFYDGATLLNEDTSAPYSYSWTPTSTGSHALTAVAVDNLNASTTSAAVSVSVGASGTDAQPPTLTLTSPTAQTQNITGSPTFTVTASDNVGVTAVDYQVDGDAVGQATSSPWSFMLPATSAYTTGVHVVRARARDAAGNVSPWSSARVTFGNNVDLPSGFSRSTYVAALAWQGTAMAWSPDGRLFICEQGGSVRVVKNGVLLATPFVTVSTSANGERGLLGVAFDPQFGSNGRVYLYYTTSSGGVHNRVSRFTANGDVAQAGETILVDLPGLSAATNHNGGALHFGPDGKLYVAVGDNATGSNAQSLTIPFGKMLRFNADGSIPTDNPFYGSTTGVNRAIWALGLRNPFSFAFDPNGSRMFINDVGQNTWEEINLGRAGANYGWPGTEGATSNSAYDGPLFTYAHTANATLVTGAAIVGGAFYRPGSVNCFPRAGWGTTSSATT